MSPPRKATAAKKTPKSSKKTAASKRTTAAKGRTKSSSSGKSAAAKKTAKGTPKRAAAKSSASSKTTSGSGRGATKKTTRSTKTTSARASGATSASKTRRSRKPPNFDAKTLRTLRERLVAERADLERQLAEIDEESFEGTQSDLTGEVGLDEDFADAGSATFERERALSIQNNVRDLMGQITGAIRRIDEGSYGICERCGKPIESARLKALPHASLCMDCKRREERSR